jgi:hypothetical protein
MPPSQKYKRFSYLSFLLFYVTVGLLALLFFLSWNLKIPLFSLLSQINDSYLFLNKNTVKVGNVGGINFHVYVYKGVILLSGLALIKEIFVSYHRKTRFSFKTNCLLLPHITFMVLLWLVLLQTVNRTQVFIREFKLFAGKPLETNQAFMHTWVFDFAHYSQAIFPGQHRCKLETDKNLNADPFMFQHRQLAYFLYPTIDLRDACPDRPVDCLIIWKQDAVHKVPEGFEIKAAMDLEHVLAVKKPNDRN